MILSASRTSPRSLPNAQSPPARNGMVYERKVAKALSTSIGPQFRVERNPWFVYRDSSAPSEDRICSPDILLHDLDFGYIIVAEVKRTWTPEAEFKLRTVYCPVVERALDIPTKPLVVARYLTPDAPRPSGTLSFALLSAQPLLHWLGSGPILL